MDAAITVQQLGLTLGNQPVLEHITFEVPQAGIVGLLGPSGAGKTTLMRILVGRQHIGHGSATVLSRPAGTPSLRRDIGYVAQEPAVYPDLTVRENLHYFAAIVGCDKSEIARVIEAVHLVPQTNQVFSTLSGGQKSRTSLAVALLGNPRLLILDEPTTGLDPLLRQQLWAQFRDLASQGTTLVVSSHVMDEAEHCDSLLLLRDGKLLAADTPAGLRARTKTATIEASFLKLVADKEAKR